MKVNASVKISSFVTFCQDCVKIYEKYPQFAEEVYLKSKFAHLSERTQVLIQLMKISRSSFGLSASDKARETAFRNAEQALKGYAVLPFAEKKEAAEFFIEIFKRHGSTKILAQKYIDTSALIDSIEKECSTEEAKTYLEKLDGLDVLFSELFAANNSFKVKFIDKESEGSTKKKSDSATSVKKELVTFLNSQILPYIDAMRLSFPEKFSDFAIAIEGAVKTLNSSMQKKLRSVKNSTSSVAELKSGERIEQKDNSGK